MPINVYTGLMRSGKSYEVVSQVILAAVLAGRDVVTNVDGISEDRIHDYLAKKNADADRSKFGRIRHVTNEDVFRPDFLPWYDDAKEAHTDTVVRPGDLVCIDEAWRFWGSDCKLLKQHKSFFLEHGHFTHPVTGTACDLVLMIQDMGTLNRFVKNVVAFSFRTHKKVSLGLGNTYSVEMWEGHKMLKSTRANSWTRQYKKEIFPLYSSFKGGADGKLVNADTRQNLLANRWLWIKMAGLLVFAILSGWKVWHFFHPADPAKVETAKPAAATPGMAAAPSSFPSAAPSFSSDWRVAGLLVVGGRGQVLMVDGNGRVRAESPSVFHLDGISRIGVVDGQRVSTFTGAVVKPFAPTSPSGITTVATPAGPGLFGGNAK